MITKKELQEYARLKGLNLGNAEKDYLIDLALLSISRNTKNEIVFKGGTCLYKFYKLERFSEDLDFSILREIDVERLIHNILSDFEKFGIKAKKHEQREPYNSVLITLRIEGPLFIGRSESYANLGIDINLKSPVFLEPELLSHTSVYQEIPNINVLCMKQEEIFAEKIRALLTRQRARDLFDLNFLLQKGIHADFNLVSQKMHYYNEKFEVNKLIKKLPSFDKYWKKELVGFTPNLPDFKQVHKYVAEKLKKLYKA